MRNRNASVLRHSVRTDTLGVTDIGARFRRMNHFFGTIGKIEFRAASGDSTHRIKPLGQDGAPVVEQLRSIATNQDFVFVAGNTWSWEAESEIIERQGDFPDDNQTSDHRPVFASVSIP